MDIIIFILLIFGYNNIQYEIEESSDTSEVPENLGSAW